ncbi:hypothetical protein [Brevibacillus laterosporus]|uniref:hypothetical protein n=1 Tax=Brevibacillus laterosporus TaxID=1465 RepID=UPI003D223F89
MGFSKRAVWLATNSEYGDRLLQIAKEHTEISRRLIDEGRQLSDSAVLQLKARIEELRMEREQILSQFEKK